MRRKQSYVCCPDCGNIISKSRATDSEFKCSRCGHAVAAWVLDGIVMVYEADENSASYALAERLQSYHENLSRK